MKSISQHRLLILATALAAVALASAVVAPAHPAHAASFWVNTTADTDDGACDFAHCTLREAINAANASPGVDFIQVGVPGSGPYIIKPTSALPVITEQVLISGTSQTGWTQGNPVVEIDGSLAGPENTHGLVLAANDSMIIGLSIYGFLGAAIRITGNQNQIVGNVIGTNPAEADGLNNIIGVLIDGGSYNFIGDGTADGRNVISGNDRPTIPPQNGFGIYIYGASANGNTVNGNYIGVKRDGATALANTFGIINLDATNTLILGNVVSGNERAVHLAGAGFVQVQGNTIGMNAAKTAFVPNSIYAVSASIRTGVSWISENEIRGNGGPGIAILSGSVQQDIFDNVIYENGGLGIDLGNPGVQPNDLDDVDTGENGLQNYPVITSASAAAGSTTVQATLNSTPSTLFAVNFYASTYCDASGHGEGYLYLGYHFPTTDAGGDVTFTAALGVEAPPGSSITATASAGSGPSEFSACFDIPLPPGGDQDFDGCSNGEETGGNPAQCGQRDPEDPWDFFDVPGPANGTGTDGKPILTSSSMHNYAVSLQDVGVVLAYVGRTTSNVYYSGDYNNDAIADGEQLDRRPSAYPAQLWRSGPPNGAISLQDVGVVLAQVGHASPP